MIIDIISLSHAEDSSKGPLLNIQLTQKKFNIEASCKIRFGPISSSASIKINSSLVQGKIKLDLFNIVELKADLTIDK